MTIYERVANIRDVYVNNAIAADEQGLKSASKIIQYDIKILDDFLGSIPMGIAMMYAGDNE